MALFAQNDRSQIALTASQVDGKNEEIYIGGQIKKTCDRHNKRTLTFRHSKGN